MLRPCGACRALVAACAHWNPDYRPVASRPLPPPSRLAISMATLWQPVTPRAVLAEACGVTGCQSVDVRGNRTRREAAARMARRGMLTQSAPRSTLYRVTDEGRRVHARLLDMDAGRF